MPSLRTAAPLAVVGGLCFAGCGTFPSPDDTIAQVQAAHGNLITAYNTCNPQAFTAAYAQSFTFITSNTKVAITTPDGLRKYLAAGCRQSPSPQVRLSSQSAKIIGQLAIATGQYTFHIAGPTGLAEVKQNYTLVMSRTENGWRIASHHVSVAP